MTFDELILKQLKYHRERGVTLRDPAAQKPRWFHFEDAAPKKFNDEDVHGFFDRKTENIDYNKKADPNTGGSTDPEQLRQWGRDTVVDKIIIDTVATMEREWRARHRSRVRTIIQESGKRTSFGKAHGPIVQHAKTYVEELKRE
jgi:hypothetical protein